MDDRFDLMLVSNSLLQPGGMDIVVDSHTAFGNDGNHFNQAINNGTNSAVADSVAKALHAAADHLPVFADFLVGTVTSVSTLELPSTFTLSQNFPNPFNPTTTLSYEIPESLSTTVSLLIYDTLGRKVRTLINSRRPAGRYQLVWNGTDDSNKEMASGVYFYSLRARARSRGTKGICHPEF